MGLGISFTATTIFSSPLNATNTVWGNLSISTNLVSSKEIELHIESKRNGAGGAWIRAAVVPIATGTSVFNVGGSGTGWTPGTDVRITAQASSELTKCQVHFGIYNYTAQ